MFSNNNTFIPLLTLVCRHFLPIHKNAISFELAIILFTSVCDYGLTEADAGPALFTLYNHVVLMHPIIMTIM